MKKKSMRDSSNSVISTQDMTDLVEQLRLQRHRDTTRKNYYSVWKFFNRFFVRLDV